MVSIYVPVGPNLQLNYVYLSQTGRLTNVPVNSKTAHAPPPGHLKKFGQIPRYVASLDGQMPHPLELQRGSNRYIKF